MFARGRSRCVWVLPCWSRPLTRLAECGSLKLTHHPCGHANRQRSGGNVVHHDAAGAYDAASADRHPTQHDGLGAQPDVFLDDDRGALGPLVAPLRLDAMKVVVHDQYEGADVAVRTDAHRFCGGDRRSVVDEGAFADLESPFGPHANLQLGDDGHQPDAWADHDRALILDVRLAPDPDARTKRRAPQIPVRAKQSLPILPVVGQLGGRSAHRRQCAMAAFRAFRRWEVITLTFGSYTKLSWFPGTSTTSRFGIKSSQPRVCPAWLKIGATSAARYKVARPE